MLVDTIEQSVLGLNDTLFSGHYDAVINNLYDMLDLVTRLLRNRMSNNPVEYNQHECWRRKVFDDVRHMVENNGFFLAYTTGNGNSTVRIEYAMESYGLIISNWCGRVRCIVSWEEVSEDYLRQFRIILIKLQLINANDPYKFSILSNSNDS